MKLYSSELEFKDQINNNRISFASVLKETSEPVISSTIKDKLVATNLGQPDLFYMESVLVSVGINKNDDYFDAAEVWEARKTPEDKQMNYEHNEKDIIGHITNCYAVDDKFTKLPDELFVDKLPPKFHIVTSEVLYTKWDDKELADRMQSIIASIKKSELFVSMECIFSNFDYVLIDQSGKANLVERNSSTAFLTKYLRAYGGDGVYDNKKIGRVIRNITFSGQGIVKKPANPDSIIFNEVNPIQIVAELKEIKGEQKIMAQSDTEVKTDPQINALVEQVAKLTASLADANKRAEDAQKQAEADAKAKAAQELSDLKQSVKAKEDEILALKAKMCDCEKKMSDAEMKECECEKKSKALSEKLAKIEAEQKSANRVAALVKAGKSEDEAKILEKKFTNVDDDAFAGIVEVMSTSAKKHPDYEDDDEDDAEDDADANLLEDAKPGKKLGASRGGEGASKPQDIFKSFASMWGKNLKGANQFNTEKK